MKAALIPEDAFSQSFPGAFPTPSLPPSWRLILLILGKKLSVVNFKAVQLLRSPGGEKPVTG